MIEAVVTDFSRVLLFPKDDSYRQGLNGLNNKLSADNPGYNFWDYFAINQELLDYYRQLNIRVPTFVFTSETIQEHLAVREKIDGTFSGILSALDFGLQKSDPQIYRMVADHIEAPIDSVLYIDDSNSNIIQARNAGMQTVLFKSNQQTIKYVDEAVSDNDT